MTTEQNKAVARRFLDASVAGDPANFKDLLSSDFVAHLATGPINREVFLQHNNVFIMAFSDRHFTVKDQVAEGDKVVTLATWRGTHSGSFQGLPPTGKQIAISAILIERIKDGQIEEHWSLFDQLSMMQQLGLVPPPQSSRETN
jgi:steroid delta-isomerase-like uncharacterized protein